MYLVHCTSPLRAVELSGNHLVKFEIKASTK